MLDALPTELLWAVLDAGTVWVSRAVARTSRRLHHATVGHTRRQATRLAARLGAAAGTLGVGWPCATHARVGLCMRHAHTVLRVARNMHFTRYVIVTWDDGGVRLEGCGHTLPSVWWVSLCAEAFERVWAVPGDFFRRYDDRYHGNDDIRTAPYGPGCATLFGTTPLPPAPDRWGHDAAMVALYVPLYGLGAGDVHGNERAWLPANQSAASGNRIVWEGVRGVCHIDVRPRALLRDVRTLAKAELPSAVEDRDWTSWGKDATLWLGVAAAEHARGGCGAACALDVPCAGGRWPVDGGYVLACRGPLVGCPACAWTNVSLRTVYGMLRLWGPVSDAVRLVLICWDDIAPLLCMRFRLRGGIGAADVLVPSVP